MLGSPANAAARSAAQNAAAAKVVAAAAPTSQPADKIIVSNLPADVNEVQIKVLDLRRHLIPVSLLTLLSRNSSIPPSVLFVMSPCTMTVLAGQKGLPRSTSREKEMAPRRTNSTTTASSMGVSIATFLSAFLRPYSWEQPLKLRGDRCRSTLVGAYFQSFLGRHTSGAEKCELTVFLVATMTCPRCHTCCPMHVVDYSHGFAEKD